MNLRPVFLIKIMGNFKFLSMGYELTAGECMYWASLSTRFDLRVFCQDSLFLYTSRTPLVIFIPTIFFNTGNAYSKSQVSSLFSVTFPVTEVFKEKKLQNQHSRRIILEKCG